MANEFYLEAIFIEYAILEDRLESVLRHGGRWKEQNKFVSIYEKITIVMEMTEEKKGLARKYFSDELLRGIDNWKEHRNKLIHVLLKRNLHTADLKQIAEEGQHYAETML